jgi:hypothetical protein
MDREDDEVVNEEVPRWGMVLVQGDALEGGSLADSQGGLKTGEAQ